jgi:hypothetical protein
MNEKPQLWNEVIVDGKSSIQIHEPTIIKQFCREEDHFWEHDGSRTIRCKNCGMENKIVIGIEEIVNGKVIKTH